MLNRDGPKYVILGGGISGLSLAFFLQKKEPNSQITILEKNNQLGGWIQTDVNEGFLFERGPHSLRLTPPNDNVVYQLFEDLNITSKLLKISPSYKKRFISYNNKLHPLSIQPSKLLFSSDFFKITLPTVKGLFTSKKNHDESLHSFFERHFGSYIAKYFLDPLVMGITGGDTETLSLQSNFPMFHKLSQKKGPLLFHLLKNLKHSKTSLLSFEGGFATLIQALKKNLNAQVALNTPIEKIVFDPTPAIKTKDKTFFADQIFSTLPAHSLAPLLKDENISSLQYFENQKRISYKLVYLGFNQKLPLPNAFGFISPSWSQQKVSGVIFDSKIFPSQNQSENQTRLTAMIHESSPLFEKKEIQKDILEELETLLHTSLSPNFFEIQLLKNAIAQKSLGHCDRLFSLEKEIEEKCPCLTLLGTSFYGSSVAHCIYQSYLTSQKDFVKNENLKPLKI